MSGKWWNSDEFKRRLAKMPAAVRREGEAAIKANAKEWVRSAQSLAPDDPATPGQAIRASIRNHESPTGGQIVRAGGETTTREGVDYAVQQEFGNQRHAAQAFFWPSYRLLKKRFVSRRRRAVSKAVKDFNNG